MNDDDDGVLRPGFASEEPESAPNGQKDGAVEDVPRVTGYEDVHEQDAAELWQSETLCVTCMSAPVCRHAEGMHEALVVVSRCLAYLPVPR